MHYLGSNSCHVIVDHIFVMKCICFLRHFLVIANRISKQLIIPEYITQEFTTKGVAMQMAEPRYLMSVMTM